MDKYMDCLPCKILRNILEVDERRTSINGPENKNTNDDHRDDIDRLYVSRKEGGRGLAGIEDSVDTSIRWLEDYVKKNKEMLITATTSNSNNTRVKRTTLTRKQKWEEKQLY